MRPYIDEEYNVQALRSMKKYHVIVGHFGSGKTEISLNIAFNAAKDSKKVTLVDLDIVNPYFRTAERFRELEAAGIRLLNPSFVTSGVEIPALPAEIYSAFSDDSDLVIFDVGGDAAGAIALGQYYRFFSKIPAESLEVSYVINARRPFSADLEGNLEMINSVRPAARMKIDNLINNTNLSQETSVRELIDGYKLVGEVSEATGLPVRNTVSTAPVLEEFMRYAEANALDRRYIGEYMAIERYMHRDWERFTMEGL